uniref:Uncharacterized protein n=1 Tax=Alexandrium catenella TaxID=2925 RepID=A0A7S1VZU0_ALECA
MMFQIVYFIVETWLLPERPVTFAVEWGPKRILLCCPGPLLLVDMRPRSRSVLWVPATSEEEALMAEKSEARLFGTSGPMVLIQPSMGPRGRPAPCRPMQQSSA